jgi:hypothetical protein
LSTYPISPERCSALCHISMTSPTSSPVSRRTTASATAWPASSSVDRVRCGSASRPATSSRLRGAYGM